MVHRAVLGLGSNKGNRLLNLKKAIRLMALCGKLTLLKVSSLYESEPWGDRNQRDFLNCVVIFLCRVDSIKLLNITRRTELEAGRTSFEKWKEREIDIDILFLDKQIIKTRNLKIPHPYLTERNFVLEPLCEIIPDFIHPERKKSVCYLKLHSKDNCKVKLLKRNWLI